MEASIKSLRKAFTGEEEQEDEQDLVSQVRRRCYKVCPLRHTYVVRFSSPGEELLWFELEAKNTWFHHLRHSGGCVRYSGEPLCV